MFIIDWLNTNSGAVQAIAVTVLVIVTAIYARSTHVMSEEMKRTRELAVHPEIFLWSVPDGLYTEDEDTVFRVPTEEIRRWESERVFRQPLDSYTQKEEKKKELRQVSINIQNVGNGPAELLNREAWFGAEYLIDDTPASLATHETRLCDLTRDKRNEPIPDSDKDKHAIDADSVKRRELIVVRVAWRDMLGKSPPEHRVQTVTWQQMLDHGTKLFIKRSQRPTLDIH